MKRRLAIGANGRSVPFSALCISAHLCTHFKCNALFLKLELAEAGLWLSGGGAFIRSICGQHLQQERSVFFLSWMEFREFYNYKTPAANLIRPAGFIHVRCASS
jgi:hypothetical protein